MSTISLSIHDVTEVKIERLEKELKEERDLGTYELLAITFKGEDGLESKIDIFSPFGDTIKITKKNLKNK